MSGVATAIAGAAIVGAVASRNASKRAEGAQKSATQAAMSETRRATEQARSDISRLFPQAVDMQRQGFQGAIDVFNQTMPQQASAFQQGNLGAQQQLLAGLPMIQSAILGGNIDYSNLRPTVVTPTANLPYYQYMQQPVSLPQYNISNGINTVSYNRPTDWQEGMNLLGGTGRKFDATKRF